MKTKIKLTLILLCLITSAISQDTLLMSVNLEEYKGKDVYIGQIKWYDTNTDPQYPEFISTLKDLLTTYTMPVFNFKADGQFYVRYKAYEILIQPFLKYGDVVLYATAVVGDIDYTATADVKIIFLSGNNKETIWEKEQSTHKSSE